ncbi:tetratricopeptide repeat protein [Dactylosporangium sp. NPDC000555]|uniref:tetratricopeptide repeat protein n=1 Tax=Dactylosporangium sp. NPDC000555 TaxID=3154260 RepID=UPI00333039FF
MTEHVHIPEGKPTSTASPHGPAGRALRRTAANYALLHRDVGRHDRALNELTIAHAALQRYQGAANVDTLHTAAELAALLHRHGHTDDAGYLLTRSIHHARAGLAADHPSSPCSTPSCTTSPPHPDDTTTPTVNPAPRQRWHSGSGQVALEYIRAVARGDFKAAIPLVAPNQRMILEAIALGQGPGSLPAVTGEVSLGEVVEDGDTATVSILGKMCRTGPASAGSTSAPVTDCIEDHDPKTKSPVFVVHLAREEKTGWKVVLNFAATGKP